MSEINRMEVSFESGDKHITHVIDGEEFKLYMMMLEATEPNLLIQNPHVKKLVEALEFITKPHIGMSGIPVNKNGAFCVEHAKEALAEWEGE